MGAFFVPTFQVKCMEVLPSWVTAVEGKTAQEQLHMVNGHKRCEPPKRVRGGEVCAAWVQGRTRGLGAGRTKVPPVPCLKVSAWKPFPHQPHHARANMCTHTDTTQTACMTESSLFLECRHGSLLTAEKRRKCNCGRHHPAR